MTERARYVSEAIHWCALSVGWAAIAGASSLIAGVFAGSIALVGFGADSIVDGVASGVLVWRFRHERSDAHRAHLVERRAAQAVGAILIAIALYVGVAAVLALVGHSRPERSALGLALASASVLVLPVLAVAKLRLSARLRSPALRGDGILSLAGACLAGVTVMSLALDAAFSWWWSDAVAALIIAGTLLREGRMTLPSSVRA